jgi:glutamine synthetase
LAQVNRSALIRIPRYTAGQDKATRAELRCPDSSCNPYLAFSGMLAAALDGIDRKLNPPKPLNNINVYEMTREEREEMGVTELPGSLLEAIEELEKDAVIRSIFDPTLFEAYLRETGRMG